MDGVGDGFVVNFVKVIVVGNEVIGDCVFFVVFDICYCGCVGVCFVNGDVFGFKDCFFVNFVVIIIKVLSYFGLIVDDYVLVD